MALITYPLNDVKYTAEDAELYNCTRTSGVFSGDDFNYSVTGDNNLITIDVGVGWLHNSRFSGKVFANKEKETLDLGITSVTQPRIDVIAIQFDVSKNETNLVVKKGTASVSPTMPPIERTEFIYELYLYSIYRSVGASAITSADIDDLRLEESVCGIMRDGVEYIPTDGLVQKYNAVLQQLKDALKAVRDGSTSAELIPIPNDTAAKLGLKEGASVDDALNAIPPVVDKLFSIVTESNAAKIELDFSQIDLSKYAALKFEINVETSAIGSLFFWFNNYSGNKEYWSFVGEGGTGKVANNNLGYFSSGGYNTHAISGAFMPCGPYIAEYHNYTSMQPNETSSTQPVATAWYMSNSSAVCSFSEIQKLTLTPDSAAAGSESVLILAGAKILILGVRK